uniref:Salicylate carboxymethyltransferase n=1 Tax=Noccaea caerulescens TaxID=107243 RepID=A0A1J3GJX1_NOCCA
MDKKDLEKEFHMTGGAGETSYARNSSLQKKASDEAKHITLETLQQLYKETRPKKSTLGIADLGCSSGPNTLSTIRDMIKAIEEVAHHREIPNQPLPEFSIFLNDLPGNDFNSIFKSLPDFHTELKRDTNTNGDSPSVFISAYPGSFYGRLFPENTIHFIHSSYSLHWLSKVPPGIYDEQGKSINKGCVNICSSSPEAVSKAYYSQFKEDFSIFLRCRSKELVSAGRMVLIILGRDGPDHVDRGNSFFWELLSRSIADLVAQGETEEEKLDSYEMHFYAASAAEIESEVEREGSFELERLEMLEVDKETGNEDDDVSSYGKAVAKTVRAVQETMLAQHFGEEILEKLFDTYGRMVDEELAKEDIRPITFVLVLKRKL